MSAALLHALERTYLAAGREVWPTPQVRDFRGWLRELHAQQQLACGGLPRCLSDFEERELWRDIVAADDSRPEALDPGIAARLAQRARRSVIEYAIPWRAVSAQGSAETEIFLEWNRQFEERCRSLNCFTVDDVPGRIEPPRQRHHVAGHSLLASGGAHLAHPLRPRADAESCGPQRRIQNTCRITGR